MYYFKIPSREYTTGIFGTYQGSQQPKHLNSRKQMKAPWHILIYLEARRPRGTCISRKWLWYLSAENRRCSQTRNKLCGFFGLTTFWASNSFLEKITTMFNRSFNRVRHLTESLTALKSGVWKGMKIQSKSTWLLIKTMTCNMLQQTLWRVFSARQRNHNHFCRFVLFCLCFCFFFFPV